MVSKTEIASIAWLIVRLALAIDYRSTILNQRITHYDNPYVGFNVTYFGDEGYPYMTVKEPITPYNDLHLILYIRLYDQPPHLLENAPLSLCQLLHDETFKVNHTISQFKILQIFNLVGENCPIDHKKIRLSPYIFPSNFKIVTDIGCGYMNVESRLLKCNDEIDNKVRGCDTLMKTVTLAFIAHDDCKTNATSIDGWVIKRARGIDQRQSIKGTIKLAILMQLKSYEYISGRLTGTAEPINQFKNNGSYFTTKIKQE